MDINVVFGCISESRCTKQAVTSTTAAVTLDPLSKYLLFSDEDCHISIDPVDTAVTDAGPKHPGGQLFVLSTTRTDYFLNVIRSTVDGNIYITKLTS